MTIISDISEMDIPESDLWIAEAKFGYSYIKDYCLNLENDSTVLEVGCGSGILLSMLASEFKNLDFEGLEPFGDGFSSLATLNKIVKNTGVDILGESYESFSTNKRFDLIFCVNVFEHLKDWRQFLCWASELLSKNGKLVVLCPNYSFPYESHFGIPIIYNKNITYRIFQQSIAHRELSQNVEGLWKSLNFVKKSDVLKFIDSKVKDTKLKVIDDTNIFNDMVERLTTDIEFQKRQRLVGRMAIFLQRIGALKLLNFFPGYLPYMKLEFQNDSI